MKATIGRLPRYHQADCWMCWTKSVTHGVITCAAVYMLMDAVFKLLRH